MPPRKKWRLGDPVPVIVQRTVVKTWQFKRNWRRSALRNYSKLACDHIVDHGVAGGRKILPRVGEPIVCRRCTMTARRRQEPNT